jgi:hypothetical protein
MDGGDNEVVFIVSAPANAGCSVAVRWLLKVIRSGPRRPAVIGGPDPGLGAQTTATV